MATAKTLVQRLRRLNGKLAKIGEKWTLGETDDVVVTAVTNATGKGKGKAARPSAVLAAAFRTAQEETERLLHERQSTVTQGCCAPTPFRRWKNHSDEDNDTRTAMAVLLGRSATCTRPPSATRFFLDCN